MPESCLQCAAKHSNKHHWTGYYELNVYILLMWTDNKSFLAGKDKTEETGLVPPLELCIQTKFFLLPIILKIMLA